MTSCLAAEELQGEDRDLNSVFNRLVKVLEKNRLSKTKDKLVHVQRLWIRYRDENCDLAQQVFGGIESVNDVQCKVEQTRKRRLELEEFLAAYHE